MRWRGECFQNSVMIVLRISASTRSWVTAVYPRNAMRSESCRAEATKIIIRRTGCAARFFLLLRTRTDDHKEPIMEGNISLCPLSSPLADSLVFWGLLFPPLFFFTPLNSVDETRVIYTAFGKPSVTRSTMPVALQTPFAQEVTRSKKRMPRTGTVVQRECRQKTKPTIVVEHVRDVCGHDAKQFFLRPFASEPSAHHGSTIPRHAQTRTRSRNTS